VTEAFLNEFDAPTTENPSCMIRQTFNPEWQPAGMNVNSLQITPRVALPSRIADFRRLAGIIDRDCGGALNVTQLDLDPPQRPVVLNEQAALRHFVNCARKDVGGEVPITDKDAQKELLAQYVESTNGYLRWYNISRVSDVFYVVGL
jgi:hypothetical protein